VENRSAIKRHDVCKIHWRGSFDTSLWLAEAICGAVDRTTRFLKIDLVFVAPTWKEGWIARPSYIRSLLHPWSRGQGRLSIKKARTHLRGRLEF
jgi:hypothetical protein